MAIGLLFCGAPSAAPLEEGFDLILYPIVTAMSEDYALAAHGKRYAARRRFGRGRSLSANTRSKTFAADLARLLGKGKDHSKNSAFELCWEYSGRHSVWCPRARRTVLRHYARHINNVAEDPAQDKKLIQVVEDQIS